MVMKLERLVNVTVLQRQKIILFCLFNDFENGGRLETLNFIRNDSFNKILSEVIFYEMFDLIKCKPFRSVPLRINKEIQFYFTDELFNDKSSD